MLIFVVQGIMSKRVSQTQCSASESSSSENEQSGSESSSSETEQSGSESSSSLDDSPYNIPDPPATWYPLGSLPATRPDHSSASIVLVTSSSTAVYFMVQSRDGSLLPLTYKSWHYVPKENKERIWREIKLKTTWLLSYPMMQANTDADDSMKRMLMSSTGKKWREWKCTVKKSHYRTFTNDAERLAHRPERVHKHQWRALVYYWGTRKAQKKAKKNKRIRKKKTLHHRTGRKPFAVVRLEETNRNKGVPASRMQVWKVVYLKEGSLASDAVNEVMTQMMELSTQMEGSSTKSKCIDEDIFVKVMGPEQPGCVLTFGLGPSIKDVFGGGYRRSQEQTHIFQAQMQEHFQLYRAQFETQMKEMMETQMAAMHAQMDATIQAQAATIQAQQTRMEHLESRLLTRGGPAAREATWGHHPMSRPQQNSHEFASLSSHQKVAQSKTKNKSKSKSKSKSNRRHHI
ncbi:hypothetical protein RHSIM_Rhsim11G0067500 [Rhododendron simsii]|uniref:Uncharacterized protein n=1 Tax=Rhododendron simsii TaxID=118357 RepID=A0A834G6N2_RHOSS|nr:hypothetical protein RHSIM_Rhsim11G0067500 [Rhododendron simsii]